MLSKLGLSRIQIGIVFRKLGLFLGSVRKMSLSCILHFFSSHVFIWSNVSRAANIQFCKNPVCKYPVCLGEAFVRVQLFQGTKQVSTKYKAGEVGTVSGTRRHVAHQPDLGRRRRGGVSLGAQRHHLHSTHRNIASLNYWKAQWGERAIVLVKSTSWRFTEGGTQHTNSVGIN